MRETQVWCESKDRADWPAGTSAGWRKRGNTRAEGSIQKPIGEASGTGMLKVPSSSFNVQQTDESTHLVNSGDFAIVFKEISPSQHHGCFQGY